MSRVAQLLEEIKQLPTEERAALLAELAALEELDGEALALHPAWQEELVRRVQSLRDGTAALHDWEEVEQELEAIIDR